MLRKGDIMDGLDNYSLYFSAYSINYLKDNGIRTLSDLFNWADKMSFIDLFPTNSGSSIKMYKEINGTVKLLKCKCFLEDPLFDIYEPLTTKGQFDFLYRMGLSVKSANCLAKAGIGRDRILNLFEIGNIKERLLKINSLGEKSVDEIIAKFSILIDFYSGKSEKKDDLDYLLFQLQSLYYQRNLLDEKIYCLEDKINNIKKKKIKKR